jgi:bifunctional non-homologous end joining protein LigD
MAHVAPLLIELPASMQSRVRKGKQPEWLDPMLATLTEGRFSRHQWLFEPKFDGLRCLVFRHKGKVQLFSRNRKPLNERYPELADVFRKQSLSSFVVDGEIVALENGVSSFAKLQQRMQVQHPPEELRKKPRYGVTHSTSGSPMSAICGNSR